MNIVMNLLFDSGKDYDKYLEMHFLSSESVMKFIQPNQLLTITSKKKDPFDALQEFFYETTKQIRNGHNVLVIEIDCMVVKPTKIFDEFDRMMMFSRTDPMSFHYTGIENGWRFDPFLNSGVRYFPASMPHEILRKGENFIDIYDKTFWGYDQVVYNWMYYQQHENADLSYGRYNWMPYKEIIQYCKEEEAHIIHFFSSRDAGLCLERMKKYYD